MILEIILSSCGNSDTDVYSHKTFSDLACADDVWWMKTQISCRFSQSPEGYCRYVWNAFYTFKVQNAVTEQDCPKAEFRSCRGVRRCGLVFFSIWVVFSHGSPISDEIYSRVYQLEKSATFVWKSFADQKSTFQWWEQRYYVITKHGRWGWKTREESVLERRCLRKTSEVYCESCTNNAAVRHRTSDGRTKFMEKALHLNRITWLQYASHAHRSTASLYAIPWRRY